MALGLASAAETSEVDAFVLALAVALAEALADGVGDVAVLAVPLGVADGVAVAFVDGVVVVGPVYGSSSSTGRKVS